MVPIIEISCIPYWNHIICLFTIFSLPPCILFLVVMTTICQWSKICLTEIWLKFHQISIFFQHFYHLLMSMRRPQGRGLELARKHIASCISELDCILKSSAFLRASVQGMCEKNVEDTTASGCPAIGFDATLNCRLSAPTPPRSIKILSWKKVSVKRININLTISCIIVMHNVSFTPGNWIFFETSSRSRRCMLLLIGTVIGGCFALCD